MQAPGNATAPNGASVPPDILLEAFARHDYVDIGYETGDLAKYKEMHESLKKQLACPAGQAALIDSKCVPVSKEEMGDKLHSQGVMFSQARRMHARPSLINSMKSRIGNVYTSTDIVAMRNVLTNKSVSMLDNPVMNEIHNNDGPSDMCHLVLDDKPDSDTFGTGRGVIFPWQSLAVHHVVAAANMTQKFHTVMLYHGMGTGKTLTLGMAAYRLINPRVVSTQPELLFPDDVPNFVWLLLPTREAPPNVRGAIGEDNVVSPTDTNAIFNVYTSEIQQSAEPNYVSQTAGVPNGADFFNEEIQKRSKWSNNVQRFKAEHYAAYNQVPVTEKKTPWFDDVKKKFKDRLDAVTTDKGANLKPVANHVLIIDECHNFLGAPTDENSRYEQLIELCDMFLEHAKVGQFRLVLASGTPMGDLSLQRATERLTHLTTWPRPKKPDEAAPIDPAAGASSRVGMLSCLGGKRTSEASEPESTKRARVSRALDNLTGLTVSYLEDIPEPIRASRNYLDLELDIVPGDVTILQQFVNSNNIYRYFYNQIVPLDATRILAGTETPSLALMHPLKAALNHFFSATSSRKLGGHLKAVVVVPESWVVLDSSGGIVDTTTTPPENGATPQLYDLIKAALRNGADVQLVGNTPFKEYMRGTTPCETQYVFGDGTYGAESGPTAFGIMSDVRGHPDVAVRRRLAGVAAERPAVQLIFVTKRMTGLDLAGVTHIYFLHKPGGKTEYNQMAGRGVRVCSSLGRTAHDSKVTIVNLGFCKADVPEDDVELIKRSLQGRAVDGVFDASTGEFTSVYMLGQTAAKADDWKDLRAPGRPWPTLKRLLTHHNISCTADESVITMHNELEVLAHLERQNPLTPSMRAFFKAHCKWREYSKLKVRAMYDQALTETVSALLMVLVGEVVTKEVDPWWQFRARGLTPRLYPVRVAVSNLTALLNVLHKNSFDRVASIPTNNTLFIAKEPPVAPAAAPIDASTLEGMVAAAVPTWMKGVAREALSGNYRNAASSLSAMVWSTPEFVDGDFNTGAYEFIYFPNAQAAGNRDAMAEKGVPARMRRLKGVDWSSHLAAAHSLNSVLLEGKYLADKNYPVNEAQLISAVHSILSTGDRVCADGEVSLFTLCSSILAMQKASLLIATQTAMSIIMAFCGLHPKTDEVMRMIVNLEPPVMKLLGELYPGEQIRTMLVKHMHHSAVRRWVIEMAAKLFPRGGEPVSGHATSYLDIFKEKVFMVPNLVSAESADLLNGIDSVQFLDALLRRPSDVGNFHVIERAVTVDLQKQQWSACIAQDAAHVALSKRYIPVPVDNTGSFVKMLFARGDTHVAWLFRTDPNTMCMASEPRAYTLYDRARLSTCDRVVAEVNNTYVCIATKPDGTLLDDQHTHTFVAAQLAGEVEVREELNTLGAYKFVPGKAIMQAMRAAMRNETTDKSVAEFVEVHYNKLVVNMPQASQPVAANAAEIKSVMRYFWLHVMRTGASLQAVHQSFRS